jgi:hypothetical protein
VNYSVTAITQLLLTFEPSLIQVSQSASPQLLTWEFFFPSALRVIAELSPLQSSTMASEIANISAQRQMPPITYGMLEPLF